MFPCEFREILRTPFLENTFERLLLKLCPDITVKQRHQHNINLGDTGEFISSFENILSVGITLEVNIQNNFSKLRKPSKKISVVEFSYSYIIVSAVHY